MRLTVCIQEFADDLRLEGRSERTIHEHELELWRLGRWLEGEALDWQGVAHKELKQYTRTRAGQGFSSRSSMICSLRVFYGWAVEQEYVSCSPAAGFKTPTRPRPVPRSLTTTQAAQLVAYLRGAEGRTARRDEALFLTALYAGLRASELASLRWKYVDIGGKCITVVLSKANHGRTVPLHTSLVDVLTSWRELQAFDGAAACFALVDKKPVRANQINRAARRVAAACGVKVTPHMLRHTFATTMLRRSGDLYGVSKALGHRQVAQTEIYLSADPEHIRATVDKLPGLEGWV